MAYYVESGQVSSGIFINWDYMFVSSGGVANQTDVNEGGGMYVYNGGTANSTVVEWDGHMFVSSGGTANSTAVCAGGSLYVSNGGVANETTVEEDGCLVVSNGGVANSTTVNEYGDLYVYSGGVANETTVNSYGEMHVDGTANDTTVNSNGSMYVSNGGVANQTTVSGYGACMYVSSGGTANSTTVSSSYMYVSNGGVANDTTVNRYGYLYVENGGTAYDVTISAGGKLGGFSWNFDRHWDSIENGSAVGADNVIIVGKSMYVSSGGVANETTVNSGYLYVYSGGVANETTVNWSGYLYVSNGGTANQTTVNDWGDLYVSNGGVANETIVNGGGSMCVSSNGAANGTIVEEDGRMCVSEGGVANDTTVNSDGWMSVSEGGVANYTTVNSEGYLNVSSGGVANETTVNSSGYLYVRSGGTASETTVNSNGSMRVYEGGVANETIVNGGGSMCVSSNGAANGTIVEEDGRMCVSEGGVANDTTVNSGGWLYIDADAYGVTVSAGGYLGGFGWDEDRYFETIENGSAVVAGNVLLVGNEMFVASGGTMNGLAVNDGDLYVSEGGAVNETTVYWGNVFVSGGAAANDTAMNGGYLYVSEGGAANDTTLNGYGELCVYSDGTASDTVVYNSGRLNVAGGTVENTWATGHGAEIHLHYGTATDTVVKNDAEMRVSYGGAARAVTVKHDGQVYVSNGGIVESATAVDWGVLYVFRGGSADDISVDNCGELHVAKGGTATRIRENGGCVEIVNGAEVTFAANSFSGTVISSGLMTIHSGTVANAVTIAAGAMAIYEGGIADSAAVVNGSADIYSGGKATGLLSFADGARVVAHEGSVIDFDISETAAGDAARVNDLSLIQGAPDYTVTVSGTQAGGIYTLAGGAAGFDSAITVVTEAGAELGAISVGGELKNGDNTYYLANRGDALMLAVSDADTQQLNGNVGNVHVENGETAYLNPGTKANNIQIDRGGVMIVQKDYGDEPVISGTITVAGQLDSNRGKLNGDFSVVLDVSSGVIPQSPMIVKLEHVATMDFNICVSADQKAGTYILADGLEEEEWPSKFFFGIGTKNKYNNLISPTQSYSDAKNKYTLSVKNDTLYLKVTRDDGPAAPTVKASTTAPTNKNVTITATFSKDSAKKQYSTDKKTWKTYSSALTVSANGTYYFRGIGKNNKASSVVTFKVSNIDKTAPKAPTVKASTTKATNKDVTLTATFSSDSAKKQYSTDNKTWKTYSKALTATKNGTYYFRGVDAAGNISKAVSIKVANIDKTAPKAPTVKVSTTKATNKSITVTATFSSDSAKKQYSTDNKTWKTYSKALTVKANGTYYFRGVDAAGNASKAASVKVANYVDTNNNKWDKATVLKGTVLGALEAKADSVDYYNVGDVAKLMLDMEKGKAKVSFYDKNKKAVKVSALTMANGSAKKKVSSLTLTTGNGTTDHFTIAALDDAVKYLKIETADKTLDSYKLAKLA